MRPDASVILCTYNRAQYLRRAIDSILNQTHKNWELIIIIDGSTDDTAKIVQSYTQKHKRIRAHSHSNQGKAYALNIGLNMAKADYIFLQDDDDISAPERLTNCLAFFKAHPAIDSLEHTFQVMDAQGQPLPIYSRRMMRMCFKKSLSERIGGYRAFFRSHEDTDFWERAQEIGCKTGILNDSLYYIRRSTDSDHLSMSKTNTDDCIIAQSMGVLRRAGQADMVREGRSRDDIMKALRWEKPTASLSLDFWRTHIEAIFFARAKHEVKRVYEGVKKDSARNITNSLAQVLRRAEYGRLYIAYRLARLYLSGWWAGLRLYLQPNRR